jgi:tRNA threonylcarbamoyladenosine biosynthesis protein TsaE
MPANTIDNQNTMPEFVFNSQSESDTERLGAALAATLPPGTTVALIGTLGAGKTRLVQAVAGALGISRDEATSPTFVLVNEYRGRRPVFHFDVYRLRDEDEFLELGPDEYFESDGLTFIEWADRVADCLPAERVEIRCEAVGETERRFLLSATSPALAAALQVVAAAI